MLQHKNSSKNWHLQDLTRTGASLSPLRTIWTSKRSFLKFLWIKIHTRKNLAKFYKVSYDRSLVSSRNSWPRCCIRFKKTAAANSIAASLYVHILWAQKKQEPAAFKITQQKDSVNNREDSIKDSITHCAVTVVNSLPLQRPLIRGHGKSK